MKLQDSDHMKIKYFPPESDNKSYSATVKAVLLTEDMLNCDLFIQERENHNYPSTSTSVLTNTTETTINYIISLNNFKFIFSSYDIAIKYLEIFDNFEKYKTLNMNEILPELYL